MSALILALLLLQGGESGFAKLLKQVSGAPPAARGPIVEHYLEGRRLPVVENDTTLTFLWYGVADTVLINGSIQAAWRRPERLQKVPCSDRSRGPALFFHSYVVPADTRVEYQFVVDGKYTLDPHNTRITPNGDFQNSEAAMPGFRPSPLTRFRDDVPHGTIDSLRWTSTDTLIHPRLVMVYLPPGYDRLQSLPTVYVHDGETARRYAFVPNILDNMLASGELPPVIAVFIPSVERSPEYMGRKVERYASALCDELVPLIDRRYRTARTADRRGMMGISAGGNIALAVALSRTDVFLRVAGQSSALTPALSNILALRKQNAPIPSTFRLYLDWGRFDVRDQEYDLPLQNLGFSRELDSYGIAHRHREVSDGHDWASWRERMPEIFSYFFNE